MTARTASWERCGVTTVDTETGSLSELVIVGMSYMESIFGIHGEYS
jgi:hypothetical protein